MKSAALLMTNSDRLIDRHLLGSCNAFTSNPGSCIGSRNTSPVPLRCFFQIAFHPGWSRAIQACNRKSFEALLKFYSTYGDAVRINHFGGSCTVSLCETNAESAPKWFGFTNFSWKANFSVPLKEEKESDAQRGMPIGRGERNLENSHGFLEMFARCTGCGSHADQVALFPRHNCR